MKKKTLTNSGLEDKGAAAIGIRMFINCMHGVIQFNS